MFAGVDGLLHILQALGARTDFDGLGFSAKASRFLTQLPSRQRLGVVFQPVAMRNWCGSSSRSSSSVVVLLLVEDKRALGLVRPVGRPGAR